MTSPRTLTADPAAQPQPAPDRAGWFRPDVEGLRAVAILLVVLHHVGIPGLTGGYVGVDVFFVISGFLITSLLLRELDATGRISIVGFYARRFVRLLPAAALVVVVTLLAAWWWLPATRFRGTAVGGLFTAFYGLNFRLAAVGTDYLAAAEAPSPLQHFWSLAVEEQFYAVWPVLLTLASLTWVASRHRAVSRACIASVLGALVVGSLGLSVWQTRASAPWGYFGPHTRAWELGLGALIAVFAAKVRRLPRLAAIVGGWVGLVAVVGSAFAYTVDTAFPGWAALVPVGGAVLVVACGAVAPVPALTAGVMRGIGAVSYSWYLWHWPLLTIGPYALGTDNLATRVGLACTALLLAVLTYHVVENRVRHRPAFRAAPWKGVAVGLSLSGLIATAAWAGTVIPPRPVETGSAADGIDPTATGSAAERSLAALIAESAGRETVPSNLTPTLEDAPQDFPVLFADGCHLKFVETAPKPTCVFGDKHGASTMVLFGDSHAAHWFPALNAIAKQRHMRLVTVTKSACSAAAVLIFNPALKRDYTECATWRTNAWAYIRTLKPRLVVVASNGSGGHIAGTEDQDQAWVQAWSTSIKAVASPGTKVVLISDTPWPRGNVPDCVARYPTRLDQCGTTPQRGVLEPRRRGLVEQAARTLGADVVDPLPWFCTSTVCPVVVGNVLVYQDGSHMTTVYSAALAGVLAPHLP